MSLREYLSENYGEDIMLMDGFDKCIVGVVCQHGSGPIVCYDREKVIDQLIEVDEMTEEDAWDYHYFNQDGAYVGPTTPCFLDKIPEEVFEDEFDEYIKETDK